MAAATARAPAADERWGFAAAPTTTPAVLLENDGCSGSFGNMNDRPSSRGSSSTSTFGSDLLDSPLPSGRTLQNSSTVMSHPQSTELRSGSFQFPRSQTSFSDALKAPLRNIATRRPTSHGKGFTLSADDFPVLVSKNSQSNSQQGHSFQGRPTFSSVILAARDEQRKIPITGGDPVSTRNFSMEAQQAQLHAIQAPDICMPLPCIDYWHLPPDHPPDRNGIWQGVASYGPCKPADTPCSFTVESFTQNGQSLHNQGEEARHGPVHGGYHPENNYSCYTHVPVDACIKSLPHLMVRKVKDNHSDALEKQVIKKDVALLEKIKCLNTKARNLRAGNISEISSCRESMVEQPKSIDVEANVASYVPVSTVFSDITSAFVMANSVSESSNQVPTGTSNVSASANIVMIDLSEGHATKSSETIKLGESADNNVYGVGNTSRNKHGSSAMDTASDIWGPGWQEHSTVDSLPVTMTNTRGSSAVDTASDIWGPGWQEHSAVDSLPVAVTSTHGSSAIDTASDSWGPGWQEHSAVDSLPVVMTNTHEDQPFTGNRTQQVHVRTADDMLNSPDYEIQHSRCRASSVQHAKELQKEMESIQQNATSVAKLEDLNRHPFVHSQKSYDAPGKSADYHEFGGWNASRNKHGSSAEDISFNMPGHGWEDHPTVDSLAVMTNTHQDKSFTGKTSQQHSWRELSAQHARQLQKEERVKLQQKAKANAKLVELNRSSFVQDQKSNDLPLDAGKFLHKQSSGGSGTTNHDTSASDTCCISYAENLNVLRIANGTKDTAVPISSTPAPDDAGFNRGPLIHSVMPSAKKTDINTVEHTAQKSAAWSDDSSAQKHLQVEDTEGQVHKQESISRVLTSASDTVDANKGPLIHNVIPSAKKTDITMIHIGQKGASESHDSTALIHLQMEEERREVHSLGKSLRGPPASESAGVKKDSLIHNVMLSAKNNVNNMMEHIAQKSVPESHENNAPKHLQVDNRRRQVRSQERVLRERSNIAESTENIMSVAGTPVDTQNAESKSHMGLSTQSKNKGPASPNVFGTVNTASSSVHKTHISGVVINSAIIPVQVSSVRGFTVGSIMLGNASLASVNQEEKTVSKEEHDDVTNSCASPKKTKQSGTNQHGVKNVKDPHGSDSIMHTTAEEPSKKQKCDAGGLNYTAVPAPTQSSRNQSVVSQNVEPAKTGEIERHADKPAYKALGLQNPRLMLPAENHTTSSDNLSKSNLDTKSLDKEVLDATAATKSEVKMELENQEDEKTSKHIGISMNGSASAAPELNEQEGNSLVLKIMKDLSNQLEQVEKQLEPSTHVPTVNRSQPPQMVSLPGFTWGADQASHSQRQYHVDGQGNTWMNYPASSYMGTTHLLPSISVPQNNGMNGNSAPGLTWDTAERVLISDMADRVPGQGNRPTQNMYRVRQMDFMYDAQTIGGIAYGAAGQELHQLNPAWFPSGQHDVYHNGGTGMYFLGMDHGAVVQSHGRTDYVAGPMVSADSSDYQLVPIPSPVFTWTSGGAVVSAGHPAEAWVSPYGEHMYYV